MDGWKGLIVVEAKKLNRDLLEHRWDLLDCEDYMLQRQNRLYDVCPVTGGESV